MVKALTILQVLSVPPAKERLCDISYWMADGKVEGILFAVFEGMVECQYAGA